MNKNLPILVSLLYVLPMIAMNEASNDTCYDSAILQVMNNDEILQNYLNLFKKLKEDKIYFENETLAFDFQNLLERSKFFEKIVSFLDAASNDQIPGFEGFSNELDNEEKSVILLCVKKYSNKGDE